MKLVVKSAVIAMLACLTAGQAEAQDSVLVARFNDMFAVKNDRVQDSIAERVVPDLWVFLAKKGTQNFDFKGMKHLGVVESPDKAFTLFLFNLKYRDGSCRHFGFIRQPAGDGFKVTELIDKREEVAKPNDDILVPEKWYGALYYQIIPVKSNGKTLYTLIGTSFNDLFTSRKVIEVMDISDGAIRFGAPLFFDGRKAALRVVFEHSARFLMTVRYMPELKTIVFDHLAPSESNAGTDLQFFGPDGSQDGFILENGMWNLKQNIDVRMPNKARKKDFKVIKTY